MAYTRLKYMLVWPSYACVQGIPLLGVIPEDTATIGASNQGMPLVLKKPPTMAALAIEAAAWRLAEGDQMDVVVLPEEKKGFLSF